MKIASLRSRQSGFTLIEIAIVLVIIGILTVGVLQGQEIIENSRVKSVVEGMKGLGTATNSYYDRFQVLPGDETAAAMTARGWLGTVGGTANGVLNVAAATAFSTGAAEGPGFWRALRGAGLIAGDASNPASYVAGLPKHSAGGVLAVATGNVYGMSGKVFACASGLSTKQVAAIDVAIDGALPATQIGNNLGNLRADNSATNPLQPTTTAPAAAAYNEATVTNTWTACMKLS
jgi:prepilin-type N-terminal cleavage/methylation domain-containing protein